MMADGPRPTAQSLQSTQLVLVGLAHRAARLLARGGVIAGEEPDPRMTGMAATVLFSQQIEQVPCACNRSKGLIKKRSRSFGLVLKVICWRVAHLSSARQIHPPAFS